MLALYRILKFVFRYFIPPPLRYVLARGVARLICRFNRNRRTTIIRNLTPLVGPDEARRRAPELLGNFLMTAVDFFCLRDQIVNHVAFEQSQVLDKAYRKSKRVMVVTAHLGNWEVGISCLVSKGYSVAGVYAPYTHDRIVRWIMGHRNPDAEWIPAARGAAEACIAAIEKGRVLGMVADIPFAEKGHRVSIAGHPARLPLGPWGIAARARATVIPAFIIRVRPGKYQAFFHDPIPPGEGTFRKRVEMLEKTYASHLEHYLKTYPTQWGVLQPFWDRS